MRDCVEMLEATLNLMDEGVIILDEHEEVLFWNKAAVAVTGYQSEELIGQRCPQHLYRVDEAHRSIVDADEDTCMPELHEGDPETEDRLRRPTLVSIGHKLGYSLPGMLRRIALRNSSGALAGEALLFYPVEQADALPHGERGEGRDIERSQAGYGRQTRRGLPPVGHPPHGRSDCCGSPWIAEILTQDPRAGDAQRCCKASSRLLLLGR